MHTLLLHFAWLHLLLMQPVYIFMFSQPSPFLCGQINYWFVSMTFSRINHEKLNKCAGVLTYTGTLQYVPRKMELISSLLCPCSHILRRLLAMPLFGRHWEDKMLSGFPQLQLAIIPSRYCLKEKSIFTCFCYNTLIGVILSEKKLFSSSHFLSVVNC